MAVKMPDLVAYGEKLNQKSGGVPRSGGSVPMPDLVAYGQRTQAASATTGTAGGVGKSTVRSGAKKAAPTSPDLGERVARAASGTAKTYAAEFTNAGGSVVEGLNRAGTWLQSQKDDRQAAQDRTYLARYQQDLHDALASGDQQAAKTARLRMQRAQARLRTSGELTDYYRSVGDNSAQNVYDTAGWLEKSGNADVERAKSGLGALGRTVVDVGVVGGQMLADAGLGALTGGSALVPMAVRSFGGGVQEARQAGATYGQQVAYGLGSGAVSVAAEKLSNVAKPFKQMFGGGVLDEAITKATGRLGQTVAGKLVLSALSEGGEEVVEDLVQPILQRATYDKEALGQYGTAEYWANALYDGLMGAAMGGIGAGVEQAGNRVRRLANAGNGPENVAGAPVETEADVTAGPAQNGVEGMKNAVSGTEAAEGIKVGQVTTIKRPYRGEVPTQTQRQNMAPVQVSKDSLTTAQNRIAGAQGLEKSLPGMSFKSTLKNVYKNVFKPAKGVVVEGASFGGKPYTVDIGNKVLGKVISDSSLTAEKLALLDNLSDVVRNGTYVGSGEYTQHSGKDRPAIRYDYFETPISINEESYIAKFDVEVVPGANNYRTHQVVKMDLTPTEASLVGPEPTASSAASSPVEGMHPLNFDNIIAQDAETVKNGGAAEFDTPGDARAGTVNTDYDRLQAAKDKFHPEGAYAARPVDVPLTNFEGRNIPKSASTIAGAQGIAGADVLFLEQQIADGKIAFDTIQDETAINHAHSVIQDKGFDGALEQYRQAASANVATKDNTALGQQLILQAMHEGNAAYVSELLTLYTRNSTTVAQAMQAQSMFRKLSPEGQLMSVQKAIADLNEKYGTAVELDEADVKDFLDAETPEERQAAAEKIVEKAAQNVPGTFRAKYDTLRYLAMLGNPRTHIRNILGNTLFQIPVTVKNRVGAIVEGVAFAATGGKTERSKSLLGANPFGKLASECRADFSNAKDFLEQSSKYNEGQTSLSDIEKKAKAFSDDNLIGKAVNKASDFNSRALEAEDTAAKKWIYTQSMAGFLKANGYKSMSDAPQSVLNRARDYAAQEALRNTFNDKNVVSDAVSDLGKLSRSDNPAKKFAGYIVEGMAPFKRTPANVAVRAAEYSPVGAVLGAVDIVRGAKAKDVVQVSKGLDRVAAGLSGTALMLAGFLAAGAGYVTGGDDDDDRQQAFNDLTGHQNYALELKNGTSITLDWLAPEAIPFFVGAELYNQGLDQGLQFKDVLIAVKNASAPMLEMSMLQGLNDTFDSAAYPLQRGYIEPVREDPTNVDYTTVEE